MIMMIIKEVISMKRLVALLLAIAVSACFLNACSQQRDLKGSEEILQTCILTEPPVQKYKDSVTYVFFDGFDETIFCPVSYVEKGVQKLTGDMGYFSSLSNDLLEGMIPPDQLPKTDAGNYSSHGGSILSSGSWNFFPDTVESQTYDMNNQPIDSEWYRYFQEKLIQLGSDSPVIIQRASLFQWEGADAAIVTAGNVLSSELGNLLTPEEAKCLSVTPGNSAPVAYSFTTLFVEGLPPTPLNAEYCAIPDPEKASKEYISYGPWDGEQDLLQCLTSLQYDGNGNIIEVPVFGNMTGEQVLRPLRSQIQWVISDVDGDGASELVFCVEAVSSINSRYWVYDMEGGNLQNTLTIGLN